MRTAIDPDALRRELGRRGMTQAELAGVAGISEATISHAMTGRRIAWTTLRRLARALTVTPTLPELELLIPSQHDGRPLPGDRPAVLARRVQPD